MEANLIGGGGCWN